MKFLKKLSRAFKANNQNSAMHHYENGTDFSIDKRKIGKNARKVIQRLHASRYEAYLVGGGVRDILLNKKPKDFDIATNATPQQVRQQFRNCRLIGRRFRLAHVYFFKEIIEVSTFRSDQQNQPSTEEGMILRDNTFGTLEEDVWRRDFTINALYYDPDKDIIVDYTNGLDDIDNGIVRIIGEPNQRYREDPVRMLRAIRFAAKLNFEIAPETEKPFDQLRDLLWNVSPSRLYEEIQKLLFSGHARASYDQLQKHQFLHMLFPLITQYLEQNEFHRLINTALLNTDERLAEGKSINPAFLVSVMLWLPFLAELETQQAKHTRNAIARSDAMEIVIRKQLETLSIPKRFTQTIKEIWDFQFRLKRRFGKRAYRLMEHKRFRAAYDFLLLRSQSDTKLQPLADWWTEFQTADSAQQQIMVRELEKASNRRRQGKQK